MIDDLDTSFRNMLKNEAIPGSELANATISFAVPDKDWRGQGSGLQLDVYLYRLLDNRELRSNERRLRYDGNGRVTEELFPARLECSYIISAWNKSQVTEGPEKELQEHRLLSQVMYVLWHNPTMPAQYLAGLLSNAEIPLPVVAGETEDMAAIPDFWSSLETYVKPTITCRITIALDLKMDVEGPMVTTTQLKMAQGDSLFVIGGTVLDASATATTVPNAWVRVDAAARTYFTDDQGNFVIDTITPGPHVLTVRAVGFQEGSRPIQVPDPSGFYDVSLNPL
jgi:YD repeat-containing protein